jgi:glycosyltransferase involved in cell wall biosynthesis
MLWPFDEAERSWLHDLINGLPNLWKHIGRIPTEAALSHLMGSCDVIAAAYLDFPHSSGIQAKAAALGKPIIVSDGYLMAERVRRFRTGEVIPQGNARRLLDAALAIMADRDGWLRSMRPQWQDYLEEHSVERLPQAFAGLLFRI